MCLTEVPTPGRRRRSGADVAAASAERQRAANLFGRAPLEFQAELASLCAAYIDHSRQADRPAIVAQRDLFNDVTGLVA
jgi:hypothetical protein